MSKRTLGLFCMIGGVAYLMVGIRFLLAGGTEQSGLVEGVLSTIWAVGGLCGIFGMIAERATGQNKAVRVLSYLPAVAFLFVIVGNVISLVTPPYTSNPIIILGLLGLVVGMLLVGFFTLFAKAWTGWRKAVPFLPALMPFIGMAIGNLLGIEGGINVSLVALSWILLGYTVTIYAETFAVRAAA